MIRSVTSQHLRLGSVPLDAHAMNAKQLMSLPGQDNPVCCADGKVGVLLHFPAQDGLCGVQVPGEPDVRWFPATELQASALGALKQSGAPQVPARVDRADQALLVLQWAGLWEVGP